MENIRLNKRAQMLNLFDIIAGFIIIAGGVFIAFTYVNLGSLLTSLGLIMEIIKILFKEGVLS